MNDQLICRYLVATLTVSLVVGVGLGSMGVGAAQDDFQVTLDAPGEVTAGEETDVSAAVTIPDLPGDYESEIPVTLYVDGERIGSKTLTVADGETTTVTFSHTFEESDRVTVEVEGELTMAGRSFGDSTSTAIDVLEAEPTPETTSVEGAAFTVPESLADDVEAYRRNVSDELGAYAFIVGTEDELYLVFTDRPPETGKAAVEGITLNETVEHDGLAFEVMAATSVSFDQSGERTTVESVATDPASYEFELVRIDATHRSVAVRTDPDEADISYATTTGVLVEAPREPTAMYGDIGERTRDALIDADDDTIDEAVTEPDEPHLYTSSLETDFWVDATATVDGIVLSPQSEAREFLETFDAESVRHTDAGEPVVYLVREAYDPDEYEDISSVTRQADDGDIVTVDARLYQHRISVQEATEAATGCGDDRVQVQSSCADLVHDVLLHSGAAWSEVPRDRTDALLVMGASSREQDTPTETRDGRYRITGEVVSTDRVDESLPEGSILLVYDLERVGDIDENALTDDGRTIIETRAGELEAALEAQTDVSGGDVAAQRARTSVDEIPAGETFDLTLPETDREALGVDRISLSAADDLEDVDVSVADVPRLPADGEPPGEAVQTLEIAVSPPNDEIERATIELRGDAAGVSEDANLVVHRYHDGEWQPLETTVLERTDTEFVLEAETPGFSYFAVSASADDEEPADGANADDGKTATEANATEEPTDGTSADDEEATDAGTANEEATDEGDSVPGFTALTVFAALFVSTVRRVKRRDG